MKSRRTGATSAYQTFTLQCILNFQFFPVIIKRQRRCTLPIHALVWSSYTECLQAYDQSKLTADRGEGAVWWGRAARPAGVDGVSGVSRLAQCFVVVVDDRQLLCGTAGTVRGLSLVGPRAPAARPPACMAASAHVSGYVGVVDRSA